MRASKIIKDKGARIVSLSLGCYGKLHFCSDIVFIEISSMVYAKDNTYCSYNDRTTHALVHF